MEKNDAAMQHKKQFDWLKAYQWKKGQSGNPAGMKKGSKSLKVFAREFLESLPDDQKLDYLKTLPEELIWKMAEGMPHQTSDLTSDGKPLPIYGGLSIQGYNSDKKDIPDEGQDQGG